MKNWYTKQEAARLLGVSTNTIYHYWKQGKIRRIPDPHRLYKEARYYKEEIDQLAAEKNNQPNGYSPSDIANMLNINVQLIYKYIREGLIKAQEVPVGDEKYTYIISEEEYQSIKETLQPVIENKIRRNEYYNSRYDIALFQHFQSNKIPTARVEYNSEKIWGFYLPITQKWIPYEEGIQVYNLKPVYSIHQKSIQNYNYVRFEIPKEEDIFYPFLDYLYEHWGVENLRLRSNGLVTILLKEGEQPFSSSFSIEDILPFLKEGKVVYEDGLLITRSAYQKTSIDLPKNLLNEIKRLAESENIKMSAWIERAITEYLKNLRKNQ